QYPYPRGGEYRYDERDRRGNEFLDRLRSDLDRAEATATPYGGDHWRIARARQMGNAFQSEWNRGNHDQQELSRVIWAGQRVSDQNRLSADSRNILLEDVQRMREFQARHDNPYYPR